MNRKNLILTVLACLNCTHTTHAKGKMEKSEDVNIQQADQDNGQESLDKLEQQCRLQNLRILVGMRTGNPNRDAAIQREEILQKVYKQKKDDLLPDNPLRSFYEALINIRGEIINDLRNMQPQEVKFLFKNFTPDRPDNKFNDKLKEWVDSEKIKGIKGLNVEEALEDVEKTVPHRYEADNVPRMGWVLNPKNPWTTKKLARAFDKRIHNLAEKYPDIAKQREDEYRKLWAYELWQVVNGSNRCDIANLGAGLQQLDEAKTKIGRDMKETVLNTLHNYLRGKDDDRKDKTIALLDKDPELRQMVLSGPELPAPVIRAMNKNKY